MDCHAPSRGKEPNSTLRLLTLTTLFPSSVNTRHGVFVANRLRRICDTGRVDAYVVSAVPSFPGRYAAQAKVPAVETVMGFEVRHPRYLNVPGIGMRLQPALLARAILHEIGAAAWDADRFDVIDAHYFYPDGVAAAHVARALGLPLVISARGSDINLIGNFRFARRAMLAAARAASGVIAVSGALRARMTALGMPADRIRVLRNGVDCEMFRPEDRVEARERLSLEQGPLILAVGNLVEEKGLDLLVRAVGRWREARLLIVGEGPLRETLQRLGDDVAPGRVLFRGNMPQADLRLVYSAATLLALPSLREGWPNVILEAMACGTPVVAAQVGGVPEIIADHAPGMVVAGRDVDTWTKALQALAASGHSAADVRAYAMQFGWDDIVAEQCSLYESIVRRNPIPARAHPWQGRRGASGTAGAQTSGRRS